MFQVRVWRALLQVPPGTLVSYGRLAAAIDNPQLPVPSARRWATIRWPGSFPAIA